MVGAGCSCSLSVRSKRMWLCWREKEGSRSPSVKGLVPQHPDREGRADLMVRASQESCTPQTGGDEEGSREISSEWVGTVRCRHIFNLAQAWGLEQLPNKLGKLSQLFLTQLFSVSLFPAYSSAVSEQAWAARPGRRKEASDPDCAFRNLLSYLDIVLAQNKLQKAQGGFGRLQSWPPLSEYGYPQSGWNWVFWAWSVKKSNQAV